MFRLQKYFLYAVLNIYPAGILCQPDVHFAERLTIADGLSSNKASDIVQDYRGFLWIGTSSGLDRYDGAVLTPFHIRSDRPEINRHIITRLILIDSFRIAVGSHQGISIFDTRNGTFQNVNLINSQGDPQPDPLWQTLLHTITMMEKDKNGNIWAATPVCLYRLDRNFKVQKIFHSDYIPSDVNKKRFIFVRKILPLHTGDVIFWLNTGQYVWPGPADKNKDTLISIKEKTQAQLSFLKDVRAPDCFLVYEHYLIYLKPGIDSLFCHDELTREITSCFFPFNDQEHIDWQQHISTLSDGWLSLCFNLKGLTFIQLKQDEGAFSISYFQKNFFPDKTLRKIISDNEGNWWALSDGNGILKMSVSGDIFHEQLLTPNGSKKQPDFEVASFKRIADRIFIASYGGGLYEWDFVENRFSHFSNKNPGEPPLVNTVWNFRQGVGDTVWLGTQTGLRWYNTRTHFFGRIPGPHPGILDSFPIPVQYTDSKGMVWLSIGGGHGLCSYDPTTHRYQVISGRSGGYPYRYAMAIAEDKQSNLWFISDNTTELVKWSRNTGRFTVVSLEQRIGSGYKAGFAIHLDAKDRLWFGVESMGIVCYDTHSGKIEVYGKESGLFADIYYSMKEDPRGRLWIATSMGLSYFDTGTKRFVNFHPEAGMPEGPYPGQLYYDTHSATMFAGAVGRFLYFQPAAIRDRQKPMLVQLTGLTVNDRPYPITADRRISLPWRRNNLAISFSGINLRDGKQNRYAYRIGDNPWIGIGSQQTIRFANLSAGTYHLLIRGARSDGDWSPVTDYLHLTIYPPFFKTVWFYLLCLSLTGGIIYGWYRYRLRQIIKMQAVRSNISRDLHDDIGAALTRISYLSLLSQRKFADNPDLVTQLKKITRDSEAASSSMREIIWNINPGNDHLHEVLPHLIHYASEMLETKAITLRTQLPEDLKKLKFSTGKHRDFKMIFKEAIHNITRHSEAKNVYIEILVANKSLQLKVQDDGSGFDTKTATPGNGLINMRERAAKWGWEFFIQSSPGLGTRLHLSGKIT